MNENYFNAARSGNKKFFEDLLNQTTSEQKINLELKNTTGHTALMLAAYSGNLDATNFLISKGADVNSLDTTGHSILMGVVFKGHTSIFDLLIQHKADYEYINPKGQSCLDLAIMFGRRDLIIKLNKLLNTNRSDGRIEQIKTWVQKAI